MKKLIFLLASLFLTLGVNVGAVGALDRIAVTLSNGNNLYVKDGAFYEQWHQLTSGVNIGQVSLAGDYIGLVDAGAGNFNIKEPSWNSPWQTVHWFTASKALVTQTSDGLYRMLVLKTDGSVIIKNGAWNSVFWGSSLEPSGVSKIVLGGDRIGVIMNDGTFKVKELVPGKFTDPASVPWQVEANNVTDASMTNNRIAIVSSGAVIVKEGAINAPWFNNIVISYATKVGIAGNRVCAIKDPGWLGDTMLECKESSSLTAAPIFVHDDPSDFRINSKRVLVLTNIGARAQILEGPLNGPNSGWQDVVSNATGIELN